MALIVAIPAFKATILPLLSIVATEVLSELQLIFCPFVTLPVKTNVSFISNVSSFLFIKISGFKLVLTVIVFG